jgi:hypothetical protein
MTHGSSLLTTLLAGALGLALIFPEVAPTAWIVAAALMLLACGWLKLGRGFRMRRRTAVGIFFLLASVALWKHGATLSQQLRSRGHSWADKAALQKKAAIFPGRIWVDRPQRVYLSLPQRTPPVIHWKGQDQRLEVQSLGEGLYFIDIDPSTQALPKDLVLQVGDHEFPLAKMEGRISPGLLSSDLRQGLAATISEETDQCILASRSGRVWMFPVGDGPSSCEVLPGGRIAVGSRFQRSLTLHTVEGGEVLKRVTLPGMVEQTCLAPDDSVLAVLWDAGESSGLDILDSVTLDRKVRISLPAPGEFLCFGRDAAEIVVASRRARCLYRLARTDQWKSASPPLALSRPATSLCRDSKGEVVYLTSTSSRLQGGDQLGNHFVYESLLTLDLKSWSLIGSQALEGRQDSQENPGDIESGCGASGLNLGSQGELLMAFSGTHEVGAVKGQSFLRADLSPSHLYCPTSIVDLGNNIHLVSYPAQGALAFLGNTLKGTNWIVKGTVWLGTSDSELETQDQGEWLRRQGEIGFYESTRAGLSCQSCHPGGDSDYARHDINAGQLWGTLSCLGSAGTGPYLRNGDYPSLEDLHATSSIIYRGYSRTAPVERPRALRAYLESLPLPLNPRQLKDEGLEAQQRGLRAFVKADCQNCHAFPAFTNLAKISSKALFPSRDNHELLDVPSLRGVWRSAPFLHDNRASNLQAVLEEHNRDGQHGDTQALSEEEKTDLIEFLESL